MKFAVAALTEPPIRNSGSTVRAAPPMMLTTWPCAALSSGQNRRVSRTAPKNFSAKPSSQGVVRQLEEIAGAGRARIVDQHVAAVEALVDALEQLLAAVELAQIAGDR